MNPKEYAEKAITIDPLYSNPLGLFSPENSGTVSFQWDYPEPKEGGVALFSGPRGEYNGGIDWPANKLRTGIAEMIESVAEDCISVIAGLEDVDGETNSKIANAIRKHFEIEVH